MSDVERFYYACAKQVQNSRQWQELHPQEQIMLTQAINMIMQVVMNTQKFNQGE